MSQTTIKKTSSLGAPQQRLILATLALLPLLTTATFGQGYILPDTLWVHVTFYDFKADGTNPNFQAGTCGHKTGMVQDELDILRKPLLRQNRCYNQFIEQWYRPSGAPGAQFIYDDENQTSEWTGLVNYLGRPDEFVGADFQESDAMANIVIYDSLPFTIRDSATGTYEFLRRTENNQFFWLDGRGFGEEPDGSGHNFGFTMELHHKFTYKGGEFFDFRGDDDVWVFINGHLVIDLGGVHSELGAQVNLDDIADQLGMEIGGAYNFDFFYAERHTSRANCGITTNILTPTRPNELVITTDPTPPDPGDLPPSVGDTTLNAGECIEFHAWVVDDTGGLRNDWDTLVQWDVYDTLGNPIEWDTVSNSNEFCFIRAHGCVLIYLTFLHPDFPDFPLYDTLEVCVNAGDPHHLLIEGDPNVNTSRFDNELDSLTIPATSSSGNVYAIIRDEYGNFVEHSKLTTWDEWQGDTIITVAGGTASLGQGVVSKVGPPGVGWVTAAHQTYSGAAFRDTVKVRVANTTYSDLRILTGEGGLRAPIDSMGIVLGTDSVLYAEGLRTDGLGWEAVPGQWSASGVSYSGTAPSSAPSWNFTPSDTGLGRIYVEYGSERDSVRVYVLYGGPGSMELYRSSGAPVASDRYQPPTTVYTYRAGSSIPLVGKIFDPYGTWLSRFETDPILNRDFTWEARLTGGAAIAPSVGQFSSTQGYSTSFTPYEVYSSTGDTLSLDLIGTFDDGTHFYVDTVRIRVIPSTALHLVIEGSPDWTQSPNSDNPLSSVELLATDTMQSVYAILRDSYGNFAGYAGSAIWESRDDSVAVAMAGSPSQGEGSIRRRSTDEDQTYVLASEGTRQDSVLVVVRNITYDSLRIVVDHNGIRDISSLAIRTDQDTTLYALGQRSDNGQWVYTGVSWSTSGLTGVTVPSNQATEWTFSPTTPGSGTIRIAKGSASDQVSVNFQLGLPNALVLYPVANDTTPTALSPYPPQTTVDTLIAGRDTSLAAFLFDKDNVWLSAYKGSSTPISWSIREISGTGQTGTLSATTGFVTSFSPRRAGNIVEIVATFSQNGIVLTDAVRFFVKHNTATHLYIEASPLASASPNAPAPLNTYAIGSSDTVFYAYAVLRDSYGNFVQASQATNWTSTNTSVVTAVEWTPSQGEGKITRAGLTGQANVIAASRAFPTLKDTVQVTLGQVVYTDLQIVVNHGGLVQIDSLVLRTDDDTTLQAIGLRSDNGQWDDVFVRWTSQGLQTNNPAPSQATQWTFRPITTGSGTIVIRASGESGPIYDTLDVRFVPGRPHHIVLFPNTTNPYVGTNQPYPGPSTVQQLTAGDTLPAVAMVFDHNNVLLGSYRTAAAPISWHVVERAGNPPTGIPVPQTGYATNFTSTKAYNEVYLYALFNNDTIQLRDTIRVLVNVDTEDHLVLEGSADRNVSPNDDNPLYSITLSPRDTVYEEIYAIVRDQFGNFIRYSTMTNWSSLDTIVEAENGLTNFGQGRILRNTDDEGETKVVAEDQNDPTLIDTIDVIVSNIVYDSVRIVVNAGGLKDIDTLRMRTDQDTTLLALGLRSDTKQWDNLRVRWTGSGIVLSPNPPGSADEYTFSPSAADTGVISVIAPDISDQVVIIVTVGLPHELALYPKIGQPGINENLPYDPPSVADTIRAGDTIQLVAKIFDHNHIWLSSYEHAGSPITWRVQEISGNPPTGTLNPRNGHLSNFAPENAYNRLYVIARFSQNGISVSDSAQFYVRPGAPHHVVLEAGSETGPNPMSSPNDDDPAGSVTISSRDTVVNIYAVLRDQFGNFVDYSKVNTWVSKDTSLVTAGDGIKAIGEARIIRATGGGGQTLIIGTNNTYGFSDTVSVVLSTISYDSLRVVVVDSIRIESLTMSTESDTTLLVQGKRSDNGLWEAVPANWQASSGIAASPVAPSGAKEWSFAPADTGSGWIWVTLGTKTASDSIRVTFNPGPASRLVLYPQDNPTAQPYSDPTVANTVEAGTPVPLVARIVDHMDVWLPEGNFANANFTWSVQELSGTPPTGILQSTQGRTNSYRPRKAFNSVYVIAQYGDSSLTLRDTILVNVRAGAPHHLVIEGDQNWQFSPSADNPIDSLTLTNIETFRSVYAIIRDSLGNYVDYSTRTDWESNDTDYVKATEGIANIGEGKIENVIDFSLINDDEANTFVIAQSREYPGLIDTVHIKLLSIYFKALRIVNSDNNVLSSLRMSTNDDTTLYVQGLRSDRDEWMNIQASWITSPGIQTTPPASEFAQSWDFSPTVPDTGLVIVTLNTDSTVPDTLPVFFERGAPLYADVEILTPADQLVAGDTITAVIRVRNRDGLVPGSYCDSTLYEDILPTSGPNDTAKIIVDGTEGNLNQQGSEEEWLYQCFDGGIDTVKMVLYHAPLNSAIGHRIYVDIGSIQGISQEFDLRPAALDTLILTNNEWTPIDTDDTLIAPNEHFYAYAAGYDQYGNRIGFIPSNWSVVPDPDEEFPLEDINEVRQTRLYYSTAGVNYDQHGTIEVVATDYPGISTRVDLTIISPPASIVAAWVRDANGNGYLDQVTVRFTKMVSFEEDYDVSQILVNYEHHNIPVDSILEGTEVRAQQFTLLLKENQTDDPQTNWTPTLNIRGAEDADTLVEATCADSAGPVIWKVTKQIVELEDRGQDIVMVTFSEDIQQVDVNELPADVFYVWERNDDSTFRLLGSFLDGIGEDGGVGFLTVSSSRYLKFAMTNRNDLTTDHYLSLVVDTSGSAPTSIVADLVGGNGNMPEVDNQKVQVYVEPFKPKEMKSVPNPTTPSAMRIPLSVEYDGTARDRVRIEGAGTVLSFPVIDFPDTRDYVVDGVLKIYDVVGNLVARAEAENILGAFQKPDEKPKIPNDLQDSGIFNYDIYWSGHNDHGMPVSPGVYRAVLILNYRGSNVLDKVYTSVIGIGR